MSQRLTSRPITPTTIRMTPTVERLMPASCAVTANFRIAPSQLLARPPEAAIGSPV